MYTISLTMGMIIKHKHCRYHITPSEKFKKSAQFYLKKINNMILCSK